MLRSLHAITGRLSTPTHHISRSFSSRGSSNWKLDSSDLSSLTSPFTTSPSLVRLSKKCSELSLLSRRECDELLRNPGKIRIYVNGEDITNKGVGYKIPASTTDIKVCHRPSKALDSVLNPTEITPADISTSAATYSNWLSRSRETIILNKPLGYVTGQPEFASKKGSWTSSIKFDSGVVGHAYQSIMSLIHNESYYHGKTRSNPPTENLIKRLLSIDKGKGLAPAGRLDINSSGLVILTRDGVMARKIIGEKSEVEKEYIVEVKEKNEVKEKVERFNSRRKRGDPEEEKEEERKESSVGKPSLAPLLKATSLQGKAIKPVVKASWAAPGRMRIVLKEGKKRQVRRMIEELMGLEVKGLRRVRVGPIMLGALPVGSWRFLSQREGEELLGTSTKEEKKD
ncbi:hypothetical protein TrLO_g8346 [Triparma laevis f. longispina]|uniref:Pseudouridine synthase RsuA/RluA-like domain-containing protein n=1 Tax=Triparma laevis f. longispina TaxID=1714387 RepID=A0A9W7FE55_9STRA|nr:hypothetical protein TrLO_g8346 [Triparma laevis f. longispina]